MFALERFLLQPTIAVILSLGNPLAWFNQRLSNQGIIQQCLSVDTAQGVSNYELKNVFNSLNAAKENL